MRHRLTSVVLVVLALVLACASSASATLPPQTTVYSNIPEKLAGNYASEAFEATSTSEFGGQVELAPGPRTNPVVTVTMSSWGCQKGSGASCETKPGAKFGEPITLNLYAVKPDNTPGELITSYTQTFEIPYRPSADEAKCGPPNGEGAVGWFDDEEKTCYHGYATNIKFDLGGQYINLPDKVIVSLAYNTSDYGYAAVGSHVPCHEPTDHCGYDSLNVAVIEGPPSTGAYPVPGDAYINSEWTGAYCDGGIAGTGVFRLDTPVPGGCLPGYDGIVGEEAQPAIRIDTSEPQIGPEGPQGPAGPTGPTGATGTEGATGPQGPTGKDGATGNEGATGPAGPTGPEGTKGSTGPQGPAGQTGATGKEGVTGPAGPEGAKGSTGPQGPTGQTGATGKEGATGKTGPTGPAGAPGKEGPAGKEGKQGPVGKEGPPGKEGRQGPPGKEGPPGKNGKDGKDGHDYAIVVIGKASSVGKTSTRGPAARVSVHNGKAVLSIRCHGVVGSQCKGSLLLSVGKSDARVSFSLVAGKTQRLEVALPSGILSAVLANGTSGVGTKVAVTTHNSGKAADVRKANVTLVG